MNPSELIKMATVDQPGTLADPGADCAWANDTPPERLPIGDELQSVTDSHPDPQRQSELFELASASPDPLDSSSASVDQLRHQLTKRQRELSQRTAELEDLRVKAGRLEQDWRVSEALLREAQSQQERRRVEFASLHEQLADAQAQLIVARQRQDELRRELAQAREKRSEAHDDGHAASDQQQREIERWRGEAESLSRKLAEAEKTLGQAIESDEGARQDDDLHRRFEMAIDEVRSLKRANAELETKLAKQPDGGSKAGSAPGLDWESQKRRLLAALEADDRQDEQAVSERHSIEATVRITDQIVARKDQEIAELKRQLDELANRTPTQTTEMSEAVDHDHRVIEERERLARAVADWREKIGKAEIDISVERAKIARDRAELEEKTRLVQHRERQSRAQEVEPAEPGKPARGRWLSRLGLKDLDDTP